MTLPVIRQRDLKTYKIVQTSTELVYQSTYEPTGCCVFIKLLSLADRNQRDRQAVLDEVEYIGKIRSERLSEYIGIYRTPSTIGIVTEWMPNQSLHSLLYQRDLYPKLPLGLCLRILAEAAEALSFLHGLDPPITHQHLKPCNILLDAQYQTKLSDFWLSERKKASASSVQDDSASVVYLSPQRLKQHRPTPADDIYSLGIILQETISRKRPFYENNPLKLETEIIRGVRPQPSVDSLLKSTGLQQSCRSILSRLTNLCWHMDPNMRPTAAECLSLLRNVLQTFSNEDMEAGIQSLLREKQRASQHSHICEVEIDIRYLDDCWTTKSNLVRTQSTPEESTEASSVRPGKLKDRSVSFPVFGPRTDRGHRAAVTCQHPKPAKNHGAGWTHGEFGGHVTCPRLVWWINYTETLRKNREVILDSMTAGQLNQLIDIMRAEDVLSRDDAEYINAEGALKCKSRKFLDICSEKGEGASRMALESLRSRNVIFMCPRHPA